ncbi:MAG: trehalose-phosphatase [Gammaproteobacteria bacterium]|nr:trehalose-phosphatase [Gammaproteobacteria bacterium]NNL49471.1 trehalose-phosphatase [Woeseiaceae bacterium]
MRPDPKQIHRDTSAIFLDVDGTLVEIRDRPEDVHADTELISLLEELLALFNGAVALVSGRSIKDIDRIFGGVVFPAVGAHGAELRQATTIAGAQPPEPLPEQVIERLQVFAEPYDGLQLEHKQGGISLHYRRAPELAPQCRLLVGELMSQLETDFRLIEGKMVFEIAPRQHNKGEAIRQLLGTETFKDRTPVFVGDDVTDEDGFTVVNALDGQSIRVGDDAPTKARYALDDVADVRDWLASIVAVNKNSSLQPEQ